MAKDTERTEIGQRLVELRNNHKDFKTQKDVADAIGIKRDTYARYETNTDLQLPIIKKLCELYHITSDYLIFGKNENTYNFNDNPLMHQHLFGTTIDYNTNVDDKVYVLSEDEVKFIENYRKLSDEEKRFVQSSLRGVIEF